MADSNYSIITLIRGWLRLGLRRERRPAPAGPVPLAVLLGRPEDDSDTANAAPHLAGLRVLITGAGGSIGTALARHVAALRPARLMLLDHAEHALWRVSQDLAACHPRISCQTIVADVRDPRRLGAVFAATGPDIVLHAAALKHVPMMEEHPLEALLTNAIGTRHVIDAARATNVGVTVLLSTDKAVYPASVMGASKRLAELYCLASDRVGGGRCLPVRFGNVLGSSGSVLELWRSQMAFGGPLVLTHPDMRRYFITPEEAVCRLLQAVVLGRGTEFPRGALGVVDMGTPIRIVDLAERLIRAAGFTPGRDMHLRFTGPRPGEKLSEVLLHDTETALPSAAPGLLLAESRAPDLPILARALDELEALCRAGEERLALELVSRLIPGFDPRTEGGIARLRA